MHVLVLILGTVLLPAACALKCYECIPESSASYNETTKDCPASTQCGSFRIISYADGSTVADVKIKRCALAEECGEASLNLGVDQAVIISKCCTSDLCNTPMPQRVASPLQMGKSAFNVKTITTKTLNCNGNEDYCISAAVTVGGQTTKLKGCSTKLICSNTPPAQISGIIGAEINCCQGDLCNSASSTTISLLLFATLLISLVMFS